jgi:plastocyanin
LKKNLAIILFTILLVFPIGIKTSFAADTWYAGEGLKEGDFFRYNLCHVDLDSCTPFEMDFWVEGKTEHGEWNLEVLVIDGNKKIRGNVEIGRVAPEPLVVSKGLENYASAYKSSIVWLSAFATRIEPQDFAAPAWGKIGSIGGMEVGPRGVQETVIVEAGSFDTHLIGWHKSTDNKIWVKDDFPFPIKALTFVDVSSGTIPIQFQFELLEYGNTANPPDFLDEGITMPPPIDDECPKDNSVKQGHDNLDSHGMVVSYGYTPEIPKSGCEIIWTIEFQKTFDVNQFESDVHYDIFVVDDNGNYLRSLSQEKGSDHLFAPVGKEFRKMDVKEQSGKAHYVIHVYGTGPDGIAPDATKSGSLKIDIDIGKGSGIVTPPDDNPPVTKPNPPMKITIDMPEGAANIDNEVFYDPSDTYVTPGSTITWTNSDTAAHTVTSGTPTDGPDNKFDSGLFGPGKKFETILVEKGTYSYFCQVHPWMTGSITVDPTAIPEFPLSVIIILTLVIAATVVISKFKNIPSPKL